MRRKNLFCLAVGLVILTLLCNPLAAVGGKMITVNVTGMGMSKDEAVKDGKRKAVEQVFVKVYSQSKTRDFVLVKDTILTRSAGFVQRFEIIGKPTVSDDDVWEVKMKVVVLKDPIDDLWGVVTGLLKDMGRPKIMVFLREKVDDKWLEMSTVQTRVEKSLLDSGFALVDQNQIKAIQKKDLESAIAEDKPDKVQAIAKQFGAQIFITGVATSTGRKKIIYNMTKYMYEADANIKVYRSDTAQLLSAVPGKSTRGVQSTARAAAKQALDTQGQLVAPLVTRDILQFWMDVLAGRGEVQLKVEGITFAQCLILKKAIKEIKGVKDVRSKYTNKNANISIATDMNAETFIEHMIEFEHRIHRLTCCCQRRRPPQIDEELRNALVLGLDETPDTAQVVLVPAHVNDDDCHDGYESGARQLSNPSASLAGKILGGDDERRDGQRDRGQHCERRQLGMAPTDIAQRRIAEPAKSCRVGRSTDPVARHPVRAEWIASMDVPLDDSHVHAPADELSGNPRLDLSDSERPPIGVRYESPISAASPPKRHCASLRASADRRLLSVGRSPRKLPIRPLWWSHGSLRC